MTKTFMLIQKQYESIWEHCQQKYIVNAMHLQVLMQLCVSIKLEKLTDSKMFLKNQAVQVQSLCNADIEGFWTFIRIVPYDGNIYECYIETRIYLYDYQNTISSMTLSPDPYLILKLFFESIISVNPNPNPGYDL